MKMISHLSKIFKYSNIGKKKNFFKNSNVQKNTFSRQIKNNFSYKTNKKQKKTHITVFSSSASGSTVCLFAAEVPDCCCLVTDNETFIFAKSIASLAAISC